MWDRMTVKGRRKAPAVCLAVAAIVMCYLCQTVDSIRLRKTQRRVVPKRTDVTTIIGVEEGKIVFGDGADKRLQSTDGNKKALNVSVQDEMGYQADFAGWGQEVAQSPTEKWNRLGTSLHCFGDHMKFRSLGPGASQLAVEQANQPPMPLSMVPSKCGYKMQDNPMAFVMMVPYDGCNVVQQDESYKLPLRWRGNPVSLQCPKRAKSTATRFPPVPDYIPLPLYSPPFNPVPPADPGKSSPKFPSYPFPWPGPTTAQPQTPLVPQVPQVPLQPKYPYPWPLPTSAPPQTPVLPQVPQVPLPPKFPSYPYPWPLPATAPPQTPLPPQVPLPKFPSYPYPWPLPTETPPKSPQVPNFPDPQIPQVQQDPLIYFFHQLSSLSLMPAEPGKTSPKFPYPYPWPLPTTPPPQTPLLPQFPQVTLQTKYPYPWPLPTSAPPQTPALPKVPQVPLPPKFPSYPYPIWPPQTKVPPQTPSLPKVPDVPQDPFSPKFPSYPFPWPLPTSAPPKYPSEPKVPEPQTPQVQQDLLLEFLQQLSSHSLPPEEPGKMPPKFPSYPFPWPLPTSAPPKNPSEPKVPDPQTPQVMQVPLFGFYEEPPSLFLPPVDPAKTPKLPSYPYLPTAAPTTPQPQVPLPPQIPMDPYLAWPVWHQPPQYFPFPHFMPEKPLSETNVTGSPDVSLTDVPMQVYPPDFLPYEHFSSVMYPQQ